MQSICTAAISEAASLGTMPGRCVVVCCQKQAVDVMRLCFQGDLAALIVFWLESKAVHCSHKTLLYQGMAEDLSARGKIMQTEQDV